MVNNFKIFLSSIINDTITKLTPVGGGDISKTYKIESSRHSYFLKLNNKNALQMFKTEANALELISNTKAIKAPKVYNYGTFENTAYLLLEYIEKKTPAPIDFENLGLHLSKLHQCTSNNFGFNKDNFIGNLPQSNNKHRSWTEFYAIERLSPQIELAKQNYLLSANECPTYNRIIQTLEPLFNNIKPSLLHGDLWSGNYLISRDGIPYLIDPAIYYGHSEVDIAMSKLFGGFGNKFYESYFNCIPQDEHTPIRIKIYQLYYLLVHLNLFGISYYQSVISILKKYF